MALVNTLTVDSFCEIFEEFSKLGIPIKNCIDGGAGFGDTSLSMLKYLQPSAKIYAYEPFEGNCRFLEDLPAQITLYKQALYSENTKKQFYVSSTISKESEWGNLGREGYSSLGHIVDEAPVGEGKVYEVDCVALDSYVKNPQDISFIKLDLQGGELHALKGMENITKYVDFMWIEYMGQKDLFDYLESLDFAIFDTKMHLFRKNSLNVFDIHGTITLSTGKTMYSAHRKVPWLDYPDEFMKYRKYSELIFTDLLCIKKKHLPLLANFIEKKTYISQMTNTSDEQKQIKQSEAKIEQLTCSIKRLTTQVQDLKERQKTDLYTNNVFYQNEGEKRFIEQSFADTKLRDNRIVNLLRGLDKESAQVLSLAIKRLERVRFSPLPIDLYSQEEQDRIRYLSSIYQASILTISDDIYVYLDKYLPIKRFFVSVFLDSFHGISRLSQNSIEKINKGTVLDVGGFIGDSCLLFRDVFPDSPLYSFECLPENIELFKKTIELNQLQNIHLIEKALSDTIGKAYISNQSSASSLCESEVEQCVAVETDTLDNYLDSLAIGNISMIKVDIEGAEQKFLEGAKKTIEKYRPVLLLSIYHNWEDLMTIKPLIESWNLNYSFKISRPKDNSIIVDTMLVCEPQENTV